MKTLINGKNPALAIAEEVKRQIKEANPSIDIDAYEDPKDIPGFLEIMERRCGISMDRTDMNLFIRVRQRMNRTGKLHKSAILDFRRYDDGRQTVAALANVRNKYGKLELQELWEEAIPWDVFIER